MKNGRTDEEFLEYADGDAEFSDFLKAVDRICMFLHGLSIFDFVDYDWRSLYDAGTPPEAAFDEAVTWGLLE